ncbi:MAG: hypothetical protein II815_01275 [Bacteroidales bacterium]|nr:hypothetical protein [Bacteroidales bacterium]
MDNRDIRRHSLSNFVYASDEIEVDSSVRLGMAYKFRRKMRNVPKSLLKWGIQPSKLIEGHPIVSASDLGNVAFADNFVYYVSEDASSFFPSTETKSTRSVSGSIVDPNSEDGCNIDLSEVTVDVAAIPQPSRNYIVSRRCRELALRIFLPLLMLFAIPIMNSCNKQDDPTPPTPTPEPIPTRTVSMDMTWYEIFHGQLADKGIADTLKDPTVQTLEMRLIYPGEEGAFGSTSSGFSTKAFHRGRDTLQNYSNLSDNLIYSGTIVVHREGGGQQPSVTEGTGMALEDSIWYASKGFQIKRFDPSATISK